MRLYEMFLCKKEFLQKSIAWNYTNDNTFLSSSGNDFQSISSIAVESFHSGRCELSGADAAM
jgi:hypothetical protein